MFQQNNVSVSVVMPAYNSAEYIAASIDSVLAQTIDAWELLIADDCSSDQTAEICKAYQEKDARIRYIRLPENAGVAAARNAALKLATGRYIAFLDSDDLWQPDKLEVQLAAMSQPDVVFSFTAYKVFGVDGFPEKQRSVPDTVTANQLLKDNVIGCLTAMYDSKFYGKPEFVDLAALIGRHLLPDGVKRVTGEDFFLWVTLLKHAEQNGKNSVGINVPLARYRIHKSSFSANKKKAALCQWLVYRKALKVGIFRAIYSFIAYAINGVIKHV